MFWGITKICQSPELYDMEQNKISNKTFPLSFFSLESINYYAVIMYTCSNDDRIITSRILVAFLHNRIKLLR